jgi:predicted ATPase
VSAAAYLAVTEWHLGEVASARDLINRSMRRAKELNNAATYGLALYWRTILESRRGDALAAHDAAEALLRLVGEHGINIYAYTCQIYANWARGWLIDLGDGSRGLRQSIEAFVGQGNKRGLATFHGLLAELEAARMSFNSALTLIDQGLAFADETGERLTDPYLHRLRGEILLKRDAANVSLAEEAFKTAIAIAREQGARSYGLLASLALAKLYQSTARTADAGAVLAPALEGFSPTPEMPEIGEALQLMAAIKASTQL